MLCSLHWLPVPAHIRFKTLMIAYKGKNKKCFLWVTIMAGLNSQSSRHKEVMHQKFSLYCHQDSGINISWMPVCLHIEGENRLLCQSIDKLIPVIPRLPFMWHPYSLAAPQVCGMLLMLLSILCLLVMSCPVSCNSTMCLVKKKHWL